MYVLSVPVLRLQQSMGARTLDTEYGCPHSRHFKVGNTIFLNEQNHRESTVGENVLVRLSKVLIFVIIYLNFLKICVCICSVRYCMLIRLLNVSFLVNPKTHQPGPDHQRHVKFLSFITAVDFDHFLFTVPVHLYSLPICNRLSL